MAHYLHLERELLELVHSDVCSAISTTDAMGGYKYFVTFVDDYSRYTVLVLLKKKSDVLEAFKMFLNKAE